MAIYKFDTFLFEMANLHKTDSKLPANVYFTCNGDVRITKHNALRVKIQGDKGERVNPDRLFPLVFHTTDNYDEIVDVKLTGKALKASDLSKSEIDQIVSYVEQNWEIVVKHWCGELTDKQLLQLLPSYS